MSKLYQNLSQSKWDCKYHAVFVPKRRPKVLFGQVRQHLGDVFHALAKQKEGQMLEGHLMPDNVPMCIAIPPKHPVGSMIGFLKVKSGIATAVGFEWEQVRQYIREQEEADGEGGKF